jgi:peptide chain release factor 3
MTAVHPTAADRRTFAIISHPDAGKTTLTEKLLLFGGAVREAGAVKSRKSARTAVSDWMALEKERGISITSTVLAFDAAGRRFNLLDTPGHADFSEDTYRTLWAADAAVMVLDAAKGMEPQTRKLFAVARRRGLPILTFVNKVDRPSLPALGLLDAVADEIGLTPVPLTWPVGDGPDFAGLVDRVARELIAFDRSAGGSVVGAEHREPLEASERDAARWPARVLDPALEEVGLLDAEHGVPDPAEPVDREAFLAGELTPVFFGSALQNFGVAALLDALARLAPPPQPQPTADGGLQPVDGDFVGQVFKVQANMDPRHRDRMAFVRVTSGRFERGMTATVARSQRTYHLKYAHQAFADDRATVATALPGDIVGLVNAADLQVGDTLSADGKAELAPIPTFAPERFMIARNRDSAKYKQFRSGLRQLDEEGVVHVLRRPELGEQEPVLAGVGELQFEVAAHRLRAEFGAEVHLEPAPWRLARGVDEQTARRLRGQRGVEVATDRHGKWLALFESEHALRWATEDHPEATFAPLGLDAEER